MFPMSLGRQIKTGHFENQIRPQGVKTGHYRYLNKNTGRTHCTEFARNCAPFRALFCVQMPIGSQCRQEAVFKGFDFIDEAGGRTRDRTLDLSRVKGTLSR
jgi:hypothetical protein